jgi:flagellar basal-body rod protein FlgG
MIRALYSAASGMTAQQMNVDNIAHNLANANTTGFKARRAQFQDLIYQTVVQPGSASGQQTTVPTGLQVGLGTRTSSNEILFTQGSFAQTDNPLDMVIQGKGFFQIRRASGELAYTRSGAFHLDKDGNIVTQDGDPLEPQITIPSAALQISIAQDGTVSYTLPNQAAAQQAGQIQLATFVNPAGLNSIGGNLYMPTDSSGDATVGTPGGQEGLGTVLQGYTEQSNVSVVEEFINLIVAQRGYEANSKVVKAADDMYQQINNLTR